MVYRKSTKQLTRSTVGHACSAAELYRIPDYSNQLIRGIVRLNLREDLKILPGFNFATLMDLGSKPLDPEMIERTAIGDLDREFAGILPALRNREEIGDQEKKGVRRFIAFARFRSPLFRRRYFGELHGALVKSVRQQIQVISELMRADSFDDFSKVLSKFNEEIDAHVYHIMLIRYACGFDPLSEMIRPKIRVLHTSEAVPFVTCDNPSRPYHRNHVKKMFDSRLPGFIDPQVQILFPLGPSACVVLSSNPSWRDFAHVNVTASHVKEINSALAIMAVEEIVFSGPNAGVFQSWLKLDQLRPLLRP